MKRDLPACLVLAVMLAAGMPCADAATADAPTSVLPTPDQLLARADHDNSTDHARFLATVQQLHDEEARLTPAQRWHLAYLDAVEQVSAADYVKAAPALHRIIERSGDPALAARATAELIQVDFLGRHYVEAYELADRLLASLPGITDPKVRLLALDEVVQMMDNVGQYDLALQYARQMKAEFPSGKGQCEGMLEEAKALSDADELSTTSPTYQAAIDTCLAAGQVTLANALRLDRAGQLVEEGHADEAIALLQRIAPSIRASGYQFHIGSLPVTLAQAYAKKGDDAKARTYAAEALALMGPTSTNWIVQAADQVLYQVEKHAGHAAAALSYYEKYVALDRQSADDTKARELAYQEVRQEVVANRQKLEAVRKQNQILQLRQRLAAAAAKSGRLHVYLLLAVIAFIGLATLWLLRSRRRFRRMARHDGLTGAFNREHFMGEAEGALRRLRKTQAGACLIVLDLDYFKRVNDTHGHVAGDFALQRTAEVLRQELRETDVLGRLGGEEFGILLPACTRGQGIEIANRICHALAAAQVALDERTTIRVTASFGLACCADAECSLRQLLIEADAALYRAKDGGRNRVVAGETGVRGSAAASLGA